MFRAENYLDLAHTNHAELFSAEEPVWSAISKIESYLDHLIDSTGEPLIHGTVSPQATVGGRVYVAADAIIEPGATVLGPAWIGSETVVRSGAYIRANVIIGNRCVLGNSSEFKNCLLFDNCEVPHFNYVGDTILGYKAHLGAGVICSNVRLDRRTVQVRDGDGGLIDTGLQKFGALVGDRTEVGCNTVLSPGSILGRDCILYPVSHWQGVLPEKSIVKHKQDLEIVRRH